MPAYLTVPDDLISLFTPLPGLTPEERGLLAEALGEATADHAPPEHPWGLFSYSAHPAVRGRGIGVFNWFETQAEVYWFVRHHLAFINRAAGPVAPGVQVHVEALAEKTSRGALSAGHLIVALNPLLRGNQEVAWIGHYEDLMRGGADFAAAVRAFYNGGGGPDRPVPEDEEEAFVRALGRYGR
jgi:hypothetical protein